MTIGVILVSYNTGDILYDCLESLLASAHGSDGTDLRVLVVDNASPTPALPGLQAWASGDTPWDGNGKPFAPRAQRAPVEVIARDFAAEGHHASLPSLSSNTIGFLQSGANDGFAAGVNHGLRTFQAMEDVDYFWVLNSDAMVEAATPAALERAAAANPGFGILGGRTFYTNPPLMVQTDGGRIDLKTGRLFPNGLGKTGRDVPGPVMIEYVAGCHMLVSRAYLDQAGLMPEDYFLFYEEVDWCMRRGDLPLIWVSDAPIHHENGASIGSESLTAGPSRTAAYWMARNRLRFIRRWNPKALPIAVAYTAFKTLQFLRKGHRDAARAALRGLLQRPFK